MSPERNAEIFIKMIEVCNIDDLKEARKINQEMFDYVARLMKGMSEGKE
jgi:hypothetical protein